VRWDGVLVAAEVGGEERGAGDVRLGLAGVGAVVALLLFLFTPLLLLLPLLLADVGQTPLVLFQTPLVLLVSKKKNEKH